LGRKPGGRRELRTLILVLPRMVSAEPGKVETLRFLENIVAREVAVPPDAVG
jgi:hypothetical protein